MMFLRSKLAYSTSFKLSLLGNIDLPYFNRFVTNTLGIMNKLQLHGLMNQCDRFYTS